jgi:hypothetical protein
VIIENVVTDIDTIVRQVRFTGWTHTQNGDPHRAPRDQARPQEVRPAIDR